MHGLRGQINDANVNYQLMTRKHAVRVLTVLHTCRVLKRKLLENAKYLRATRCYY